MIIVLKQSGTLPQAKLVKTSSTEQEKEKKKKLCHASWSASGTLNIAKTVELNQVLEGVGVVLPFL